MIRALRIAALVGRGMGVIGSFMADVTIAGELLKWWDVL